MTVLPSCDNLLMFVCLQDDGPYLSYMRLNLASCWCAILYFFSRPLKQGLNRNAKMSIPDLMTLWSPSNSPDFFVTCYLVVKRYHWVVVAAVVTVVVVVVVVVVVLVFVVVVNVAVVSCCCYRCCCCCCCCCCFCCFCCRTNTQPLSDASPALV